MFYGFSVLLFMLALATGLPVIPQLLRMKNSRQNSATTNGLVKLDAGPAGGAMSSILGRSRHPQIFYQTPDGREHSIEVLDNSTFKLYRYKSGDTVTVVYDTKAPWQAYLQKEWNFALRDLWLAGAELFVAIVLWNIGLALKLPV